MAKGKGKKLATAYVDLIPSLDGATRRIEKELADIDVTGAGKKVGQKLGESAGKSAGEKASKGVKDGVEKTDTKSPGKKLGSKLGSAMSDAFTDAFGVSGPMSKVTDALEDVVSDVAGSDGALSALGETGAGALGKIAGAAPIAGAAVAAIGGVAVTTAADFETAEARITAAVGGVGEEADALKEAGRDLYTDGWGDSMTQLSDSLIMAREILGDISEEDLAYAVEGALALEEVYGSDLNETLRGTRTLIEDFGLSAEEAMDLMVTGTQRGLDYTDELGDNLSEYAGRWADAGIEASEYFSMLEAGADNGAYQLDKVGDFLNEFLTSLSDGRMEEGIGAFSEGTQQVFEDFKNGGADARDVLDAVVGELAEMPDSYEKAQIASELWSSLGEDNALSMIESLADVEDSFDDVAGASQEMTDQVSDDLGSKWETALRKWQDLLAPAGEFAVDLLGGVADAFGGAADAASGFIDQQTNIGELNTYFGELETTLSSAMESMGYDVDYLKLKLSEAGVGMEEMDAIGSGHIRALATTFNGNVSSMVWAIENYNDVPLIDKDGTVSIDDAELVDAQGNVYTWNGSELVDQNGNAAVNDQDLIDAQGRVYTWNGTALYPKSTYVSVDTSGIDRAKALWDKTVFGIKTTSVNAYVNNIPLDRAVGGVMPDAGASGFIATGPTLMDGGTLRVGEDGAEAVFGYGGDRYIVPLTNRKYSAPFADVVAQQVAGYLGGSGRSDQSAVVAAIAALRADIAQMGVYLDSGKLVGGISKDVNRSLGRIQRRGSLA